MPETRRWLLVALCLLAAVTASAQTPGDLQGLIVDSSGAAVPAADVRLQRTQADDLATISGADGRFVLRAVAPGDYILRVIAAGFAEERMRVTLTGDATPEVTVALQPAAFTDTVTVTASRGAARLESPASTSVLTASELMNGAPVTI